MPTTGKPSRACYRCRQRRVKCDLGQPECQKCLRLGQPCPGYRTESELVFQNENLESYPESASRDHRKANIAGSWVLPSRSVPSVMSKVESNIMAQIALFDELIYNQEPPPRSLSESWDDHAIPLIISQFSAPLANGERFYGFMDFFPDMVSKADPSSPLILCCKAVAFIYFDNRFTAASEGSSRTVAAYGKALAATNTTLSDRNLSLEDETLVCVWLLSVYETLRGATMSLSCPGRPPSWNMHVLGLTTLLQMRSRSEFLSGGGRRFLWMLIGVVESRSLAAGVECPKEILSWLEDHISDFVPEELDMHHSLVHGYHASVVCAKIRKVIDTGHVEQDQSILSIIKEARTIGQEAEVRLARDLLTRPLYLRQAHIHNFHRAVRIHVQYSILELLQSSVADDPKLSRQFRKKQHNLSISAVQNLTQDTLATISYILGSSPDSPIPENQPEAERPRCWGDGMRFLWPLRVIGSRKVITAEQREIVEKTLQRLSTELCIRAAMVPYAIPKQMQLAILAQMQTSARSKGCKTCRRRKVKCDEEKPLCQRCQVSQLECEGYESPPGDVDLAQISAFDQGIIDRLEEPTLTP